MQRYRRVLLAALALASACFEPTTYGNGKRKTEERELSDFSKVDSRSSLSVELRQADSFGVKVSVDSNVLPLLEIRVEGDTLVIDSERDVGRLVRGPHVVVTMPALRAATLSGSGQLRVLELVEDATVRLRLSGSGELEFEGEAPRVEARLDGSGELALSGDADAVTLDLDGAGLLDAEDLSARSARIDLSGSGEIRASVDGPVDVSLSGSGDIDLFGECVIEHSEKRGSGRIRRH